MNTVAGWALALVACALAGCRAGAEQSAAPDADAPRPAVAPPPPPPVPASRPLGSPSAPPEAPRAEDVRAVVEHLLGRIEGSGLTFIRNGKEHTAAEAAAHVRRKAERLGDEIETPEDFIDKAATKSSLSGRPYLVKLPDRTTRPVADWLREELVKYRADRGDGADGPDG